MRSPARASVLWRVPPSGGPVAAACVLVILGVSLWLPSRALAYTVTVPDEMPTIQAALDSLYPGAVPIDTIRVRAGDYPERLHCRAQVTILGLPDAAGAKPAIDGLSLTDRAGGWSDILFRDLRFKGGVRVSIPAGYQVFRDCEMDSGVVYILDSPSDVGLIHCDVQGRVLVGGGGRLVVDSCRIRGSAESMNGGGEFVVLHSRFEGPGSVAIWGYAGWVQVEGNVVLGFDRGIWIGETDSYLRVRDNIVEDCLGEGILIESESPGIVGNRVARCGSGIRVDSWWTFDAWVSRNVVLDCAGDGLRVRVDYSCLVDSNVVGRCGGDGALVTGPMVVRNNTVFSNMGSGLVLNPETGPGSATNNIAYGNGGYGLLAPGPATPTARCNDWFENEAGPVGGMDSTGTGFSLPPGFCDLVAGDVHLRSSSPLLDAPGCGQIGALGLGCDGPTATLVLQFRADRLPDGIRVIWQIGAGSSASEPWLERSDNGSLAWMRIPTERARLGEGTAELDRDARPDRTYWYRLVAREGDETVVLGSPLRVDRIAPPVFRLGSAAPSPSSGPVRIEFELEREAEVSIAIYDLLGREVATMLKGRMPAGPHHVEWSGRDDRGASTPSGIYIVRYRHPDGESSLRIVRSH